MAVIRVVIADDDDAVRRALVAVLSEDDRFEVAGQAGDGTALHTMVDSADPDVVLLDVQMPGGGVEAAKRLRSGTAVVIVVSGVTNPTTVSELLRAGVRGYFAKGQLGLSLTDFVARCHRGEVILTVPTASEAIDRLSGAG